MTSLSNAAPAIDPAALPGSFVRHLLGAVGGVRGCLRSRLRNHAARRDLLHRAYLDPRFARDIGLTHTEIEMAARMPSWLSSAHPNRF